MARVREPKMRLEALGEGEGEGEGEGPESAWRARTAQLLEVLEQPPAQRSHMQIALESDAFMTKNGQPRWKRVYMVLNGDTLYFYNTRTKVFLTDRLGKDAKRTARADALFSLIRQANLARAFP